MRITFLLQLIVLLPLAAQAQSGFQVESVLPAQNERAADPSADLVVTFTAPVDPATVDARSFLVFGRWSGVVPGTYTFEDGATRLRFSPDRPYLAGETVTASLSRKVTGADGTTMPHAFAWQFWARTLPGTLDLTLTSKLEVRTQEEIDQGRRVQTYGAFAGDLDADGYTDFVVPNEFSDDIRVFMNDGTGDYSDFTIYPLPNGNLPSTNEGSDFNLDGHMDFAVGSRGNDNVSVFMGDGTGQLIGPENYEAGDGVRGLTVLDMNGDGYMDIATANRAAGKVALLHNQGDGTFVTVTDSLETGTPGETAAATADIDEDGILDLFIGAYGNVYPNDSTDAAMAVLLGDGDGGFTVHTTVPIGGQSWMVESGDVNGDGHVDVVSANSMSDNVSVLLGDGTGDLSDPVIYPTSTPPEGGSSWPFAIDLGDLDGDGDLDMVSSNYRGGTWDVFENLGDGTFGNRRTFAADEAGSCAVLHDRDRDGRLDMTGIDERTDRLFIFSNTDDDTAREPDGPTRAGALLPAFPNPFETKATLTYHLDAPAAVHLAVYDVLGRSVRTLVDGPAAAGEHRVTWDGTDDAGHLLPAGIYFYRLDTPSARHTRPLVFRPAGH